MMTRIQEFWRSKDSARRQQSSQQKFQRRQQLMGQESKTAEGLFSRLKAIGTTKRREEESAQNKESEVVIEILSGKLPRKKGRLENSDADQTVKLSTLPEGTTREHFRAASGSSTDLKPHSTPTKLVLAFDIGTTYSGISYCIYESGRAPEILGVTRFPAQELVLRDAKLPSLLYYDRSGNFRAAGFEVLTESILEVALTEEWTRAEWWKLHLRPRHLASSINPDDDLPPLPPGKSAVDVLTDFIKYLFACARTYIQEKHLASTWSTVENSIEYIFTHPNGWEDVQQQFYRQAIERAGLIPRTPEGRSRVHMLTEGEASLHFCISNLLNVETTNVTTPQGVVIIDAGGGTVDLSMFSVTSNPISCEEIAPAECRLQGSVFVTHRAKALLQRKLEGWEHSSEEEISEFADEFDQSTKLVIKSDQEPVYVKVDDRRYNNSKYNIMFGKLKLTGEEATSLFNDSVDAIIDAFEHQQKSATIPVTMAFLVGGFASNDWLLSRLQLYFEARSINIVYSGNHINKAAANGAVLCHIDRDNHVVALQVWRRIYNVIERASLHMPVENVDLEQIFRLLRMQEWSDNKIVKLRAEVAEKADEIQSLRAVLRAHEQKYHCEVLYAQGRINDAVESLQTINTTNEAVRASKPITDWIPEFTDRCISALERTGDDVSNINRDEAIIAYSTALCLSHRAPSGLLMKWANMVLIRGSVDGALAAATKFKYPKFVIFCTICDALEKNDRITEAITCLQQMKNEIAEDMDFHSEQARWVHDFQRRCRENLEKLSDVAMGSKKYKEAVEHLSTMLLLYPVDHVDILIKRSKAQASMKLWGEALSDADKVIDLSPSSHRGYEMRQNALHRLGRNAEALQAFDMMLSLSKQAQEGVPDVDGHIGLQYVDARPMIQRIVEETTRFIPQVLIDTTTGRLYNKQAQAEAFEALPIYNELVLSMTTKLNEARIRATVKEFYRYVMLSHRWEAGEPLLHHVENISVYDLEASSSNIKLQKFCILVRYLGFRWAWSDTCCIDKSNNITLQESLVAMFSWYRGSSLTIVYLRGVSSMSRVPGGLRGSIWNTRAWTYQEYVAAETVLFYTEDWKPYLGLTTSNHKESPDIISEMQQATGVSAQEMAVLRPGLDRVREKLYLASTRKATLVEDAAYSLFGIFNIAISVIYGERNRAVGRFLDHILTGSGDVTVLAWTGRSGDYNSCLPRDLAVYNPLIPPHIPRPIEEAEMKTIIMGLRSSLPDLTIAKALYKRLSTLPSPSAAASRLKLPGITCSVTKPVQASEPDSGTGLHRHMYRATTSMFGDIEIETAEDLTGMEDICVMYPWIRPLLDQEHLLGAAALDETACALRLFARLRQPFGALLFVPRSRIEYRRVAADSLIMAQISEEVPLDELMDGIRTIEIQ